MKLEVLIACMHQKDKSIVYAANATSDVLVINQTDKESIQEFSHCDGKKARIIATQERGLSRSRNMAINKARNEICLLVDDDEILKPNYERDILEAYIANPDADIIAFALEYPGKIYPKKGYKVSYPQALRIGSCQISFKRKSIIENNIQFDLRFGSGTKNGPGEENLFLFECLRKGLKIIYCPLVIGAVKQEQSEWFHGFNSEYFLNRGKVTKALLGSFLAFWYALYFAVTKHDKYKSETNFLRAFF
ncbi:glycosyltransferase family 2 protein [Antarcticibacterium sp. 1MA-6-2]|uniref:glycosyltransferase family A protein n=1 Tax=Antarcticibacterium sp. 1MA-6-2 TaxID=2908210 RepID=UPI001F377F58|nr:glycosyltransferase family A protein [Antarcticibacterium sp. 1MA-6-2]UJH89864.1 glycosyltransferase family 2 protein [Antarcticibacterium sp. 1MA-6-2]